jgi:hypothetical protein
VIASLSEGCLLGVGEAGRLLALADFHADILQVLLELPDQPARGVRALVIATGVHGDLPVAPLRDDVARGAADVLGEGLRVLEAALAVLLRGDGDVHRFEVGVYREGRWHLLLDRHEADLLLLAFRHPYRLGVAPPVGADSTAVAIVRLHLLGRARGVEAAAAHLDGAVPCRQLVADESAEVLDEDVVPMISVAAVVE